MVFVTGLIGNLNHITRGVNNNSYGGLWLFLIGIALVVVAWLLATPFTLKFPRLVQHAGRLVTGWWLGSLEKEKPVANYGEKDLSPYFWPNGTSPDSQEYRKHLAEGFKNYKVKVVGLVENPVEFSYAELQSMPKSEQIGHHYCIQGWSGMRFEPPRYHCGYSSRAFPPEKVLHPILDLNIVLAIAIDYKI